MSEHTKGRAVVEKVQEFPFGVCVFVGGVQVLKQDAVAFATSQKNRQDNELAIGFPAGQRKSIATFIKEQDANAALIAEAFNTYTETGRTPAQLAAERAELVAALEGAEMILAKLDTIRHLDKSFGGLDQLRAILAKVKGPVQS